MPNDFQSLIDQLNAVSGDALHRAQREALTEVGKLITEAVVTLTPVQAGKPEGLLQAGELADAIKPRVHIATDEQTASGDTSRVTVAPTTTVTRDVANWIENGHVNARAKTGAKRTDPYPFISQAKDEVEDAAIETYAAIMTAAVKKVMK